MNVRIKNPLFRAYDLLSCLLTLIACIQVRIVRRYGITNFPIAHRLLLKLGVFPIIRHFYEPLFHPDDLSQSLNACRNLPGIQIDIPAQLSLLKEFHYNDEIVKYFGSNNPMPLHGQIFPLINKSYGPGCIDLYYNVVRHFKPSRIIEVGSGYSTMVAMQAMLENEKDDPAYHGEVMAIEPHPWFRHEKLKLLAERVENTDLSLFTQLRQNDILFIDSSHMIRPQGDVLFEILQVLPSLAPGVIVHVHDIFTPRDYPEQWVKVEHKFWNEQYLLEAFLSCNDRFKILLAPNYLGLSHRKELVECCPLLGGSQTICGSSLWMQCGPARKQG